MQKVRVRRGWLVLAMVLALTLIACSGGLKIAVVTPTLVKNAVAAVTTIPTTPTILPTLTPTVVAIKKVAVGTFTCDGRVSRECGSTIYALPGGVPGYANDNTITLNFDPLGGNGSKVDGQITATTKGGDCPSTIDQKFTLSGTFSSGSRLFSGQATSTEGTETMCSGEVVNQQRFIYSWNAQLSLDGSTIEGSFSTGSSPAPTFRLIVATK